MEGEWHKRKKNYSLLKHDHPYEYEFLNSYVTRPITILVRCLEGNIWKVAREIKNFPPVRAWKEGTQRDRKHFTSSFARVTLHVFTRYHTACDKFLSAKN